MRLNEKRHIILRALNAQKRNGGRPTLRLTNRPTCIDGDDPILNKSARPKKRPMEEAEKLEIHKRTGSTPYLEVVFK